MKITIEPSNPTDEGANAYYAVSIDTRCNDEETHEAVDAALDALRAYGHASVNIADAAREWAGNNGAPR